MPPMIAPLQFRCLGSFSVIVGDAVRSGPPPKKGREFIQYLALYPRRVASLDDLAQAFWPGLEAEDVRHRIHLAASGARGFLRPLLGGFDPLQCRGGGYAWHPEIRLESDFELFLERCRTGTVASLRAALELYGGDFLAGQTAEWLQPMRTLLATERARALVALGEGAYAERDYPRALSYGLELVDAERGHESAARLVMRCLAGLGLRSRALEQYGRLTDYLAEHIGVEPSEETVRLARQLAGERTVSPPRVAAASLVTAPI
jgi:DNA-binding SARP family transcriptional activator